MEAAGPLNSLILGEGHVHRPSPAEPPHDTTTIEQMPEAGKWRASRGCCASLAHLGFVQNALSVTHPFAVLGCGRSSPCIVPHPA